MKKIAMLVIVVLFTGQLSAFPDYYPADTVNFETSTLPWWITPNMQNCWLPGVPNGTIFNSAFSAPNAIVTNLGYPYPPGNWSTFQVKMPLFYYPTYWPSSIPYMATYLEFRHKFDTDTLQDFCTVSISYDSGLTYVPLSDTNLTNTQFSTYHWAYWVDEFGTSPLDHQVSGSSGGWKYSRYLWIWYLPVKSTSGIQAVLPDSVIIRFTFTSDGTHSGKEGWMIDDIITGWADMGGGMPEHSSEPKIYPNPAKDWIAIDNVAPGSVSEINIYDLTGRLVTTSKVNGAAKHIISLEGISRGAYLAEIRFAEGTSTLRKIVVQ